MDAEALFHYELAPLVRFSKGGTVGAKIRDNSRREYKDVISLADGTLKLALRVDPASKGQLPSLVVLNGGKVVAAVGLKKRLPKDWTDVRIQWDEKTARITVGGEESDSLALPTPIDPQAVAVQTAMVDNLQIEGDGKFSLDWEKGYAATVQPCADSKDVVSRIFGFDAYMIGQDPTKRDFPMIQVLNGSGESRVLTFAFDLRGEVTGLTQHWSQNVLVSARSSAMVPVKFPSQLKSDVYHMDIRSDSPAYAAKRHFLSVENRNEAKGPIKFGLHDSDRGTFGFWPDSLPMDICHFYALWGYIHGPMWKKDPGITAETPAEEWNWDPRLEQGIQQGLIPYVGLVSRPFYPWMREREYEASKMDKREWGILGGYPNMPLYRKFVKTFAERYKGKVHRYEVENEPNAYHGGIPANDYVEIARAVSEEVHSVDPLAQVFGICGTNTIVPWMKSVFEAGGAAAMDGVSIHTYVTPRMPDDARLPERLKEIQAVIASTGKAMPLLNSETGTYVALREEVEHPIPPARLKELIKQGVGSLSYPAGWPNYAVDEWSGSSSIVRNVIFNFLGGAENFIFFGWNDKWPKPEWTTPGKRGCMTLLSASMNEERTPSLLTLSVGVLTAQLNGAKQNEGRDVDEGGIRGGIFPKEDGGEVAVLWSPLGKRSALIENQDSAMEIVSLFGQQLSVPKSGPGGKSRVRLDVGPEPIYIHTKQPGLHLLPSPVIDISQDANSGFQFTLVNKSQQAWAGSIGFTSPLGWIMNPASASFSLKPGERTKIQSGYSVPAGTKWGIYALDASLKLPDGTPFTFPISINVRPTVFVPKAPTGFAWDQPTAWKTQPLSLKLDQPDQVMIGRAPLLTSYQEEQYWKGPAELSGEVRLASDDKDLFVYMEVTDANQREPKNWPGVLGSTVEVYLDRRPADAGLGKAAYGPGVHQFLVKAPTADSPPMLWENTAKLGKLEGLTVAGAGLGKGKYWIALRIPRDFLKDGKPETFGFDIGVNGPPTNGDGRKTQIMLFGSANSSTDASAFGSATIPK